MRVTRTHIPEVLVVEPQVHRDGRGYFVETYRQDRYVEAGLPTTFVQDNRSRSTKDVLRGLHAQRQRPQGKLVQVVEGEIFDVAVDLRAARPRSCSGRVTLSAERADRVVPPGFAHGFCVFPRPRSSSTSAPPVRSLRRCDRLERPPHRGPLARGRPLLSEKDRLAPEVTTGTSSPDFARAA
jgi:dTDP-4-dehydrorhamnose 3,5-epimerase